MALSPKFVVESHSVDSSNRPTVVFADNRTTLRSDAPRGMRHANSRFGGVLIEDQRMIHARFGQHVS